VQVVVLGGTRFIGRAIVAELVGAGHDVVVVHRGETEPDDLPEVAHVHADRRSVGPAQLDGEVLIDTCAMSAADAEPVVAAVAGRMRLVVLSSQDVYAAYGELHAGTHGQPVPIDETSPLRTAPLPYGGDDYEKLDVEARYLQAGGTVLRLPAVYGEHDPQRREEFVLRRVRAGRRSMPFGPGTFLWTRAYVGDVAVATRLAAESPSVAGEVLNVSARHTWTMRQWAEVIVAAAGADLELVTVPGAALPDDLRLTATIDQHVLTDSAKARRLLGWADGDPVASVRRSVAWHLANPPDDGGGDWTSDEEALRSAR
jgi:UDP-glucose 4-epimerase